MKLYEAVVDSLDQTPPTIASETNNTSSQASVFRNGAGHYRLVLDGQFIERVTHVQVSSDGANVRYTLDLNDNSVSVFTLDDDGGSIDPTSFSISVRRLPAK